MQDLRIERRYNDKFEKKNFDTTFKSQTQLIDDMSTLIHWIGNVVVLFEKIEDTEAKHVKRDTHMTMVIKPIKNLNTKTSKEKNILFVLFVYI